MINVTYGSAVYCSVDDVAKLFRKQAEFGTDTNPSDRQVLDFIEEATDEIDDYTRSAWRENKVEDEMKEFSGPYGWDRGRPINLNYYPIRTPMDDEEGDKIEIYRGDGWSEWLSDDTKEEGRDGEYWLDANAGILYVFERFLWRSMPQIRVSYRYGKDVPTEEKKLEDDTTYEVAQVPRGIRKAASRLAAIDLISTDQHSQLVPGGEGAPSPDRAVQRMEDEVWGNQNKPGLLARHKNEPAYVEPY